jgi:REP element-mobilizing transposase RayT
MYFITSCCKDRIHHFGEVCDGKMVLNLFGEIAKQQIIWLSNQYPYVIIHNFVIMPNHVHLLMEIDRSKLIVHDYNIGMDYVGTGRDLSLHNPSIEPTTNKNIKIKSVSSLMGAYKTTTSKQIHLLGNMEFQWQRSFHDRIVRDEQSFYAINQYINNNPINWERDVLNMNQPSPKNQLEFYHEKR